MNRRALVPQLSDGAIEIDRVPVHDRGGDEAQARGAKTLVLESAVADFALAMEEHRSPQRVACLAFVEPGVAALAERRIGQPLQGKQGPFDPPKRTQRPR